MKARTYRPKVQNGTITKRNKRAAKPRASASSRRGRRRPGSREGRGEEGPSLFLTLVMVGALVAMGFVFAIRSQISTRQLGKAEERLRGDLDEIADQQRYDVLEQQRTMSLGESDRTAQQAGLIQPRLSQTKGGTDRSAAPRPVSRVPKTRSNNRRPLDRLAQGR
ncbi:MAG: hypothetical protein J2P31_12640 [Blastocatellia bacterium]|nr:hypothetical protein [Blastocatellia bacterium]